MTKDEMRENIKNNLIDLRVEHELTQSKLASIIEKSPNAVASWEQGLSLPDVTTLYRLALYYGVFMEYFYKNHKKEGEEE
jgi:transcriptional regulator with XRE-family HTH domain